MYYYDETDGFEVHGFASFGDRLNYFDKDLGMLKNTSIVVEGVHFQIDENGNAHIVIDEKSSPTEIMLAEGLRYLGASYSYDLTEGMDCSGLTMKALEAVGITAKRFAYEQWFEFKNGDCVKITDVSELQPGDLVFFSDGNCEHEDGCEYWNEVHHVGIYFGDGKMLEAISETDTSEGVTIVRDMYITDNPYICLMVRVL
jgi:cell wall-associated NlpC family hydrolase